MKFLDYFLSVDLPPIEMAGSGPTALPQLFNELHRCCQNQEFQRVVQVANRYVII